LKCVRCFLSSAYIKRWRTLVQQQRQQALVVLAEVLAEVLLEQQQLLQHPWRALELVAVRLALVVVVAAGLALRRRRRWQPQRRRSQQWVPL